MLFFYNCANAIFVISDYNAIFVIPDYNAIFVIPDYNAILHMFECYFFYQNLCFLIPVLKLSLLPVVILLVS